MGTPVVLSYGLGVDSTAILHRWLVDPGSRDFDLADLVVVTAQVGNEYERSRELVEKHLFPLMRQHHVRYVQLCRKSHSDTDRYHVLEDSRAPTKLFLRGQEGRNVTLGHELLRAGTLQPASGTHICMMKWKAFPIDGWLVDTFGSRLFRHVFGYNADEADTRVYKLTSAAPGEGEMSSKAAAVLRRTMEFPLLEWADPPAPRAPSKKMKGRPASWTPHRGGWGREAVEVYCRDAILGGEAEWTKSACFFCPYSNGRPWAIEQLLAEPKALLQALVMEHSSLGLNPRLTMFSGKSLRGIIGDRAAEGDARAARVIDEMERATAEGPWAVWRVRRVHYGPGNAKRCIERGFKVSSPAGDGVFTKEQAETLVRDLVGPASGIEPVFEAGHWRVWYERRREGDGVEYPFTEMMDVAGLALAGEKAEKGFEKRWAAVHTGGYCSSEVPEHDASDPTTMYQHIQGDEDAAA